MYRVDWGWSSPAKIGLWRVYSKTKLGASLVEIDGVREVSVLPGACPAYTKFSRSKTRAWKAAVIAIETRIVVERGFLEDAKDERWLEEEINDQRAGIVRLERSLKLARANASK